MITDEQVRRLMNELRKGKTLAVSAARAGMDEKTARKYRRSGKLPSSSRVAHTWRTRPDPFEGVWDEVREHLVRHPGLEAKTLFAYLQRRYEGRFSDGQLRTLQRRVRVWRATEGPGREVMFPQVHEPGKLAESDFTHMSSLGVTIGAFCRTRTGRRAPFVSQRASRACRRGSRTPCGSLGAFLASIAPTG